MNNIFIEAGHNEFISVHANYNKYKNVGGLHG